MGMAILVILILCFAVVIILTAKQPDTFRTTRSIHISAPASAIFSHVNNLRNFNVWNPWAKIDPNSKVVFEGPPEGVGSKMSWDGNNQVGKGSMTNMESRPNELIQFKMEFVKPMQATNTAEFMFKPEGNQTVVTWSMYGKNTAMGKVINMVMNCDKIVGGQFEKGLANLKTICESK